MENGNIHTLLSGGEAVMPMFVSNLTISKYGCREYTHFIDLLTTGDR